MFKNNQVLCSTPQEIWRIDPPRWATWNAKEEALADGILGLICSSLIAWDKKKQKQKKNNFFN